MQKLLVTMMFFIFSMGTSHAILIRGAGAESCGTWIKEKSNFNLSLVNMNWVLGAMSALAQSLEKDVIRGVNNDAIEEAITKYCKENPLDSINDASINVFFQMVKKKEQR